MSDNLSRSYIGSVVLGLALAGGAGLCLYLLMRKEEDWEVQEGVTSKQVSIEMKIPMNCVGSVIGRQGSNIKYEVVMKCPLYKFCVQGDYGEDRHKDQLQR